MAARSARATSGKLGVADGSDIAEQALTGHARDHRRTADDAARTGRPGSHHTGKLGETAYDHGFAGRLGATSDGGTNTQDIGRNGCDSQKLLKSLGPSTQRVFGLMQHAPGGKLTAQTVAIQLQRGTERGELKLVGTQRTQQRMPGQLGDELCFATQDARLRSAQSLSPDSVTRSQPWASTRLTVGSGCVVASSSSVSPTLGSDGSVPIGTSAPEPRSYRQSRPRSCALLPGSTARLP